LAKLDKLSKEKKLGFKATYKLGRIIKKIQNDLNDYYANKRTFLEKFGKEKTALKVEKEGEEPKEVGTGEFDIIDGAKYQKYMIELVNTEIELTNIFAFTVEDLDSEENLIDTDDFFALGEFIEQAEIEATPERKKIAIAIDEADEPVKEPVLTEDVKEVLSSAMVAEQIEDEVLYSRLV